MIKDGQEWEEPLMKKRTFILLLAGIIALMLFAYIMQNIYEEQTANFGLSAGSFFIAIFCLFLYKNALIPMSFSGPKNTLKRYYNDRNQLHVYKKICKIALIVSSGSGILFFLKGLFDILFVHTQN